MRLVAPGFKAFVTQVCLAPAYPLGSEPREVEWTPRLARQAAQEGRADRADLIFGRGRP